MFIEICAKYPGVPLETGGLTCVCIIIHVSWRSFPNGHECVNIIPPGVLTAVATGAGLSYDRSVAFTPGLAILPGFYPLCPDFILPRLLYPS